MNIYREDSSVILVFSQNILEAILLPVNDKSRIECDNLFTYGTLQSGQSRNRLLQNLRFEKATLRGYRKIYPPSLGFPFIIKDNNASSSVDGEIYYGLTSNHWKQIDLIEGEGKLYHRILVEVETESNVNIVVYVYYPSHNLIEKFS